jgi:hypothetical protein
MRRKGDTMTMTDSEIDQLASWLSSNHDRPLREIMDAITRTWPDATAKEIKRAIQRMKEIAREKLNRQTDPIKRRSCFRLVETAFHR